MQIVVTSRRYIDYWLVVLLLLLIGFNIPYWVDVYFPRHDTLQSFTYFFHSYNHIYYNNSLPVWQSFHPYGQDAIFNNLFYGITPISSSSLVVGRILNVTNVLHLFKFSVFMEQLAFLVSIHLLTRALFKRKHTAFLICLVAIGSIVWNTQIHLNFRIYAYFPLIFYLLIRFYREERGHYMWMAGLVGLIWATGTVYMVMLWVPLLLIILCVLLWHKRSLLKSLFERSTPNIGMFILLIMIVVIQLYTLGVSFSKLTIQASGRDSNNLVSVDTFISYGGRTEVDTVTSSLIYGFPVTFGGMNDDTGIYFGILPLLFFIVAVTVSRQINEDQKPFYRALVLGLAFLATLSLGGIIARFYYYIPPLPLYRHISLFMGLIRLLMIIISGFYIERLINDGFTRNHIRDLIFATIFAIILSDLLGASDIFLQSELAIQSFIVRIAVLAVILLFMLPILKLILRKKQYTRQSMIYFIIGAVLFDLVFFQIMAYRDYPISDGYQQYVQFMNVTPVKYQSRRVKDPITERQWHIFNLIREMRGDNAYALYTETNLLMQFDDCEPRFRPMGIASFPAEYYYNLKKIDLSSEQHRNLLHCDIPKLRLAYHVTAVDSNDAVWELLRNGYNIEEGVIIVQDADLKVPQTNINPGEDIIDAGDAEVISFSEGVLSTQVEVVSDGAWLVYADAFAQGWQATINGVQTPIYRAYGIFKTIYLEQGNHRVEFQYRPSNLYTYMIVFVYDVIFSLILFGVFIYLCVRPEAFSGIQLPNQEQ